MEFASWLQVVGGILGAASTLAIILISFLTKGWLSENESLAKEREQRYNEKFETLQKEVSRVENVSIQESKDITKALSNLSEEYVPRKEMEAIVKRIEAGNETTLTYLKKMDVQVDRLTRLFLKREEDD